MNRKRYFLLLSVLCLLFSNGCKYIIDGGNLNVSRHVTQTDAEKIFGVPMRLYSSRNDENESFCHYTDSADGFRYNLEARQQAFPDSESLLSAEEMYKKAKVQYGKIEPLAGIADSAWIYQSAGEQIIFLRRKKTALMLTVSGDMTKGAGLSALHRIAEQLATKI